MKALIPLCFLLVSYSINILAMQREQSSVSINDLKNALYTASELNDASTVTAILQKAPGLAREDIPMRAALKNNSFDTIRLLIEAGADPNITDDRGTTPLMRATQKGDIGMVKFLLDHGASKRMRNEQNRTAYGYASFLPESDTRNILMKLLEHFERKNIEPLSPKARRRYELPENR